MSSFPDQLVVPKFNPNSKILAKSTVVVVGSKGTGKSTIVKSFGKKFHELQTLYGFYDYAVGSFQSFLDIPAHDRGNIDFLIFCGLPSRRDVERVHERYSHLFGISANRLYEVTQQIQYYKAIVIDISLQVRLGNEKAGVYSYLANVEKDGDVDS